MSDVFVVGGTMKPGTPTYIERKADSQLYDALLAGHFCSVLTTRQMGKSSLMARTAARLREQAIACAIVDLQGKGDRTTPREQWYYGFLKDVAIGLELSVDLPVWWKHGELLQPAHRLTDFFADVVLKQIPGRVMVFIDEVDWMIRLPFSDEFFASVRSCFNRRATDPAFERLSFVLLGSASPAQLIKDPTRTPFNIGRGIDLTDFTADEARPLARLLGHDGEAAMARILYWTDGHPYLTQMLCQETFNAGSEDAPAEVVDLVVRDKLLSSSARQEENNLKFVADRLTQGTTNLRAVLHTYREVLYGEPVRDLPASPIHTSLRLSGVVKPDMERYLRVRNRVYQAVFDEAWVREKTPVDRLLIIGLLTLVFTLAFLILGLWPPTLPSADVAKADRIQAEATLRLKNDDFDKTEAAWADQERKAQAPAPANAAPTATNSVITSETRDRVRQGVLFAQQDLAKKRDIEDTVNLPYVLTKMGVVNRELDLLWLVMLAGWLGACLEMSRSFSEDISNRMIKDGRAVWYLRSFVGAILALVSYAAIRGIMSLAGSSNPTSELNPFRMAGVAALVGIYSRWAMSKLRKVFDILSKADADNKLSPR